MSRKRGMSNDVVLKGPAAQSFVAHAMCNGVKTEEEATAKLEGTTGPMRRSLVAVLQEKGFLKDYVETEADSL